MIMMIHAREIVTFPPPSVLQLHSLTAAILTTRTKH